MLVGIDVVDVGRFRELLNRRPKITERLFVEGERSYAEAKFDPSERYAARFAAKEAVMKALGAGFGEVAFKDVEVCRSPAGRPTVQLRGRAAERAERMGVKELCVSLSHTARLATAVAVAVGGGDDVISPRCSP